MLKTWNVDMMGTIISVLVESDKAESDIKAVCHLLKIYENRFNANASDSELALLNDNAGIRPINVHPDLFELIEIGKKHSLSLPSNLNIAIGPLVQSWRIGFSDANVPDKLSILKLLTLTNPKHIILDKNNQTVFLSQFGMRIDLGALAKGYIADRVMDYLKKENVVSAMIDLGGNILVYGDNSNQDNGKWNIGIQHPLKKRGENLGILTVRDKSVVTSGIYERHLQVNNEDYHHILDPQTGYPIETEMISLTIVSRLSVNCEIWTTRLFGLPLLQAMTIINESPIIEGIIITKDNRIVVSNGLKTDFRLLYT